MQVPPGQRPPVQWRRGPFAAGDRVQLTDAKGRLNTITLQPGGQWHTHRGWINHDDLIGKPEGIVVRSTAGLDYLALRPLYRDIVLSMPRGAAVIYPKDAAAIIELGDIYPGAVVIEAGVGSGALTMMLLRSVGATGRVHSFERRADFAEIARANVESFLGPQGDRWTCEVADLNDGLRARRAADPDWRADRAVLDMLTPWECIDDVAQCLVPGAVLVTYVATTTQLSRMAESLRSDGRWTDPQAQESLVRGWHLEGLAVRPEHRMIGHTGFLLSARRLADGTVPPVRRTRPAKGAYDEPVPGMSAE